MTPDHRIHLRALAARVRTEEPTIGLAADLHDAGFAVHCLTSLDAAAAAMPEGWILTIETPSGMGCTVEGAWDYGDEPDPEDCLSIYAEAPTEPRARTAAALLAMAAEEDIA